MRLPPGQEGGVPPHPRLCGLRLQAGPAVSTTRHSRGVLPPANQGTQCNCAVVSFCACAEPSAVVVPFVSVQHPAAQGRGACCACVGHSPILIPSNPLFRIHTASCGARKRSVRSASGARRRRRRSGSGSWKRSGARWAGAAVHAAAVHAAAVHAAAAAGCRAARQASTGRPLL